MEEIFNDISQISQTNNSLKNFLDSLSKEKEHSSEINSLIKDLKDAQSDFEIAVINYDFIKEPEILDYYIYKIKATQIRYQYLLKKLKEKGL